MVSICWGVLAYDRRLVFSNNTSLRFDSTKGPKVVQREKTRRKYCDYQTFLPSRCKQCNGSSWNPVTKGGVTWTVEFSSLGTDGKEKRKKKHNFLFVVRFSTLHIFQMKKERDRRRTNLLDIWKMDNIQMPVHYRKLRHQWQVHDRALPFFSTHIDRTGNQIERIFYYDYIPFSFFFFFSFFIFLRFVGGL